MLSLLLYPYCIDFLCTYIVLKASSCVTFSVIFSTKASIVCIQAPVIRLRVSFALAIRFFDISINHYTPNFFINDFFYQLRASQQPRT